MVPKNDSTEFPLGSAWSSTSVGASGLGTIVATEHSELPVPIWHGQA